MCSESGYFCSQINSLIAATKSVAIAFSYSILISANKFQKSKNKSNQR